MRACEDIKNPPQSRKEAKLSQRSPAVLEIFFAKALLLCVFAVDVKHFFAVSRPTN
jgi:hypothetical protein